MLGGILAVLFAAAPQTIAVLDLKAHEGVSADLAQSLTEQIVFAVRDEAKGDHVIGSTDIASLLGFERQRSLLGCQESSCLAELGGALGAKQLVTGSLSIIGGQYVLVLRRISTARARTLGQTLSRLPRGDEGRLPDVLLADVRRLFGDVAPVPVPTAALAAPSISGSASRPARVWPWVLGAGALAAVGGAAVGWYETGNYYALKGAASKPSGAVPIGQATSAAQNLTWGEPLGIAATAVALALVGGAIWTW
jgi:hypothetical protein